MSEEVHLTKCVQLIPNLVWALASVCVCVWISVCACLLCVVHVRIANIELVSHTPIFISLMFFHVYLSFFHSLLLLFLFSRLFTCSLMYSFIANTPRTHSFPTALSFPLTVCPLIFFFFLQSQLQLRAWFLFLSLITKRKWRNKFTEWISAVKKKKEREISVFKTRRHPFLFTHSWGRWNFKQCRAASHNSCLAPSVLSHIQN